MKSIDTIRLSEKQKQQLMVLRRKTGIDNWNVLCRWALCISLADSTAPPEEEIPSDSNVEMTWKTFGGENHLIYSSILSLKHKESDYPGNLLDFLKLHMSRGISLLSNSNQI